MNERNNASDVATPWWYAVIMDFCADCVLIAGSVVPIS
jgi:predicted membrane channel-forming protein YqfA (hemolysin III family)